MKEEGEADDLRERAELLLQRLAGLASEKDLALAKQTVEGLRNVRDYDTMGRLAEAVSRRDPDDATNRRLYAQCLIDTGKVTAAAPATPRLGPHAGDRGVAWSTSRRARTLVPLQLRAIPEGA